MGKFAAGGPEVPINPATIVPLTGTLTAIGPSNSTACYGNFNVNVWGSIAFTLNTTLNSNSTTVTNAGSGLAVGQTINSTYVSAGSTAIVVAGNSVTLSSNATGTGASASVFEDTGFTATVRVEKSYDGGVTWLAANEPGTVTAASFTAQASMEMFEPELGVYYRLNCTAYTSGTINYRISASPPTTFNTSV